MRFTRDQLLDAWVALRMATDNALIARVETRHNPNWGGNFDTEEMIRHMTEAAAALGYSFEPLPVTDKPGFDGRDDRSLGMKEADVT